MTIFTKKHALLVEVYRPWFCGFYKGEGCFHAFLGWFSLSIERNP